MELIIGVTICILAIGVSYILGEYFERRRKEQAKVGYTYPVDGEEEPFDEKEVSDYIRLAAGYMRRRHQAYGLDKGYYRGHLPTPALVEKIAEETEQLFEGFHEMEDVLEEPQQE